MRNFWFSKDNIDPKGAQKILRKKKAHEEDKVKKKEEKRRCMRTKTDSCVCSFVCLFAIPT